MQVLRTKQLISKRKISSWHSHYEMQWKTSIREFLLLDYLLQLRPGKYTDYVSAIHSLSARHCILLARRTKINFVKDKSGTDRSLISPLSISIDPFVWKSWGSWMSARRLKSFRTNHFNRTNRESCVSVWFYHERNITAASYRAKIMLQSCTSLSISNRHLCNSLMRIRNSR